MTHKLLVITAGTVAAGVGLEFEKQVKAHPASNLQAMVRYIDTAYLPTHYSELRSGEWFQMTISPQLMDNIRRSQEKPSYLKDLLFPGLLPQIAGSGGGSIRYNAAGAILINQTRLKEWLQNSITNLVNSRDGEANLSIALVVSAVGATGSGSLERLVDIIVECAQSAQMPSPVHCDVYILQPGMEGVSDLGLSNTLALYAEMAASRLAKREYDIRGRVLMVGWGSQRELASIDQLQEIAAALIRVTHDPATGTALEFQEREADNHVLREQDSLTGLPSHLSSANVITIGLGDLEERIIQQDAAYLVDNLVFGGKQTEAFEGVKNVSEKSSIDRPVGSLVSILTSFLKGETPEDRYEHLSIRLTEDILPTFSSLQTYPIQLKGLTVREQAERLRVNWQHDKEEIAKNSRKTIQMQGNTLVRNALNEIIQARRDVIATKLSLRDVRDDYAQMKSLITSTLAVIQEVQGETYEKAVTNKLSALERAFLRKDQALQQAIEAVQSNLKKILRYESHITAIEVLRELQIHCDESLRDLDIALQRLFRQRKSNPQWVAADHPFHLVSNHPLYILALSTDAEITSYANLVSIFSEKNQKGELGGAASRAPAGDEEKVDQLAAFRRWLRDEGQLDTLFEGEIEVLLELAHNYAQKQVHNEMQDHSVLDILLRAGEQVLQQRLREAAFRGFSLVQFDRNLAPELRERRLISAYYRTIEQRTLLEKAITKAFGQECILINSRDPTEITVFYYVDGLPMSAVRDLTGRCLEAFLNRRRSWFLQTEQDGNISSAKSTVYKQKVGVPVYSGRDAQQRVLETGVIRRLYEVRGQIVGIYRPGDIPELIGVTSAEQTLRSTADVDTEGVVTGEGVRNLLIRIASIRQFLTTAGFDCSNEPDPPALGFLAIARMSDWQERFPKGLYVRILLGSSLDQGNVGKIHLEAQKYSDYALVVIDQQPKLSGWMAIGGLRTEEKDRFVFLPIAESLIKEGLASNKERQTLSLYIDKHLGKDFDPYEVRSPVSDAVSFFGRENLMDEILHALKRAQNLGLFGLHKMGKSSVLQRLQKKAEFPVAYVCLSEGDSLSSIYKRILEGWATDIRIKYPNLQWSVPQTTLESDPKITFDSSTKELLRLLEEVTNTSLLAIFLDEIENIVPYRVGDEATLRVYINFMGKLRGLQQEINSLALLVAGIHPHIARRNYFWSDQKNPMHQVISERFLLPLDQEECAYMIRSLGQQINLIYDDEAVKLIIQCTSAHPFLARMVCSLAYKNKENIEPISVEYIQKIIREFVSNKATASYFDEYGLWAELGKQHIWGESISYTNYRILSSLAHSPDGLTESELYSGSDKQATKLALSELKERGIIAISGNTNRYYISIGLFRDWIYLHKPFVG